MTEAASVSGPGEAEFCRRERIWAWRRGHRKASIEAICALNHELLRPDETVAPAGIERRRLQRSFGDGSIADEVKDHPRDRFSGTL